MRFDERRRQSSPNPGDEPHRHVDRSRRDGGEPAAHRGDDEIRRAGVCLEQHEVGATAGIQHRLGRYRLDLDTGAIHRPHEPPAVITGQHGEHRRRRCAATPAPRSPSNPLPSPCPRSGNCSTSRAAVASRSISSAQVQAAVERVGVGEQVGAQPPQRPARRVAVDEVATKRDELAGRGAQPGEGVDGLGDDHRRVPTAAARNVTELLHRMHRYIMSGPSGVAVGGPLLLLPSHLVAKDPPADLELTPLGGEARPLSDWLTTFHLATVALDPYTNESAWILPTATRILEGLRGSDARVNLLVTAPDDDAKAFLGPLVKQFLVFVDADRSVVKALGLETLPAFVFIRVDTTVPAATEGWNPAQWRSVAATIAATTAWQPPDIPMIGDPGPFHGTPALA